MLRETIVKKPVVVVFLLLQLIALVLFPPSTYNPTSQEWWLPVLLAVMILISDYEIIFRKQDVTWPWYLLSFAQGFNIISRLMMAMPHATVYVNGEVTTNGLYLILTFIAMLYSAFMLWYMDLPEVRMVMLRD